jgi:glucose/mannose transport system permease protein
MAEAAVAGSRAQPALRALLWSILILFALFYLAPLYVMVATSLKSVEEIR